MSVEVLFPSLSRTEPDAEGVVVTWFVGEGDFVTQNQLIAEVQVDKLDAEVLAPMAGTLRIVTNEGEVARQSSVVAYIDEARQVNL
ncbi:biotin/lipoyl-containing protein [Ferrimicrobium acidiphilum]|uniref:Dihydrolipoyllysine-residue acetyltransferase component of pyruvate dehydrogenase complex n=1 Tax=Ferrimicrobium acidiphilum DSM 19497 TaxID=1121877 RepID=A0A0D8FWS1_9ACTN|nr:biotin/lipoyl-containing protein [Ferrimicrobium acidiphilum]KJE77596.1 dihydrolipoyllysine-residue acetyltransferase component of pyruvate dehydrogenase complex [Ferrimicrobium acidiphilum DSM 19497]MCL5054090.1 biotin attachment protein [Gammaproteobacteria bacterium]